MLHRRCTEEATRLRNLLAQRDAELARLRSELIEQRKRASNAEYALERAEEVEADVLHQLEVHEARIEALREELAALKK